MNFFTSKRFFRNRYGQFAVAFAVFAVLTGAVCLYWRGEYCRRAAAAAAERRETVPHAIREMRKFHGIRSPEADESRTRLLREKIFSERDHDAALLILAELAQYGMTPEIRADAEFTRGHILLWQKQSPDPAAVCFQNFLRSPAGTADQKQEAAFYLGIWHRQHGRREAAENAFRFVLRTGPESKWKKRAAALLKAEVRP